MSGRCSRRSCDREMVDFQLNHQSSPALPSVPCSPKMTRRELAAQFVRNHTAYLCRSRFSRRRPRAKQRDHAIWRRSPTQPVKVAAFQRSLPTWCTPVS